MLQSIKDKEEIEKMKDSELKNKIIQQKMMRDIQL
jgi:hypothetical protein